MKIIFSNRPGTWPTTNSTLNPHEVSHKDVYSFSLQEPIASCMRNLYRIVFALPFNQQDRITQ